MSTISMRTDPEVKRRMRLLQQDNKGIAERKIAAKVRKDVLPLARKLFRTTRLPSGLNDLESKYLSRVEEPRSIYIYKELQAKCLAYSNIPDQPYERGTKELLEQYNHPYTRSTRYKYNGDLDRNKRALKKAASLPKFGKKKDQLAAARQYVENVIYSEPSLSKMYSIMPGYRTQQSPIDNPKVRLVWAFPVSTWYMECCAYDDGLTRTIEKNKGDDNHKLDIKTFYDQPTKVGEWCQNVSGSISHWVNIDATQYDASVRGSELADTIRYLANDFEYTDLLSAYQTRASLVLPDRDLERTGGMPSGSKITNFGDGQTNVWDILEQLERLKLRKYLVKILVNGDDITLGMSTKLTKDNLIKLGRYSRRELNPDKTMMGDFVWNSKWYVDENLITRPIFRAINSFMYKENQSNPITGSKEYVTLAFVQQCQDIENHPMYESLEPALLRVNKYPLSQIRDSERFAEAAEYYYAEHYNAQQFGNQQEFIDHLFQSRLVQAGG